MARNPAWLRDMIDLLQNAGLGVEALDLFEGPPPDIDSVPGAAMGLNPTAGRGAEYTFDGGAAVAHDYPRFQVLCRDAVDERSAPEVRCNTVYAYFDSAFGFTLGGAFYPRLMPLQTPFSMGRDPKGFYTFAFNVEATRNG